MNRLQTIDADTLQSTAYEPVSFVVDDLLPQGLHLLAGAPKIGKSWLALWLCLCAAQGKPLWTFATHPCEVLYLCLEDSFQRTLKTWQIDRGQGEYGIGHDDAPPPQLALAYALTVHKSQGSQYDTVLMPVSMATARMLYRNLLYTAISRAGKEVILVGSGEALNTAMQCIPYPRKSKLVARTNLLRLGRSA